MADTTDIVTVKLPSDPSKSALTQAQREANYKVAKDACDEYNARSISFTSTGPTIGISRSSTAESADATASGNSERPMSPSRLLSFIWGGPRK